MHKRYKTRVLLQSKSTDSGPRIFAESLEFPLEAFHADHQGAMDALTTAIQERLTSDIKTGIEPLTEKREDASILEVKYLLGRVSIMSDFLHPLMSPDGHEHTYDIIFTEIRVLS